ncbi:MAG TPA: type II toxin-antitoxin system VapC family toxin [Anaeromyxobacter sp.]
MIVARGGRVMADADVVADLLNGRGEWERVAELIRGRRLVLSTVAAFEVWCGLRTRRAQDAFRKLLRGVRLHPLDALTAARAAEIHRVLEERGTRIAQRDALIAGACLATGLPLITRNRRHFERVSGLQLV